MPLTSPQENNKCPTYFAVHIKNVPCQIVSPYLIIITGEAYECKKMETSIRLSATVSILEIELMHTKLYWPNPKLNKLISLNKFYSYFNNSNNGKIKISFTQTGKLDQIWPNYEVHNDFIIWIDEFKHILFSITTLNYFFVTCTVLYFP